MKISIVMPVLNEEKSLPDTLSRLSLSRDEELVVVDGGSSDRTVDIARTYAEKVIVSGRGRGCQMNRGAEASSGDILLFLHADCVLPDNAFGIIRRTLTGDGVAAGAFDITIDHGGSVFRVIELFANLRSRVTSIPYGDQGIFLTRETFHRIGPFAEIPLMEDIELSRRLRKTGKIAFVGPPLMTSPRRWLQEGPLYTTIRDWTIALSYRFLNVSPDKLVKYYRDVR